MAIAKLKQRKGRNVPPHIPNIFEAAASNNVDELQLALSHYDIDVQHEETQMSPIHYAIAYGGEEAAALLIDQGANLTTTDQFNRTPLRLLNEVHGYGTDILSQTREKLHERVLENTGF